MIRDTEILVRDTESKLVCEDIRLIAGPGRQDLGCQTRFGVADKTERMDISLDIPVHLHG